MYPLFLEVPFKYAVWGGKRINRLMHLEDDVPAAEAWLLSAGEDGESSVKAGSLKGTAISELAGVYGKKFFGTAFDPENAFPFCLKLIDAKDRLPVGVATHDRLYYVAEAENDAQIIYGFNRDIDGEEFYERVKRNTLAAAVNYANVKAGDFVKIPAGTLFAFGKNMLLYEISVAEDKFFAVSDYGRTDIYGRKMPLRVERAGGYADLSKAGDLYDYSADEMLYPFGTVTEAVCENVKMSLLSLAGTVGIREENTFLHISVLSGEILLSYPSGATKLCTGENMLVPADTILKLNGYAKLLLVSLKD